MIIAAIASSLFIREGCRDNMETQRTNKEENDNELVELSARSFDVLSELRSIGQLCDAVLKVENKEFLVHRAILSARSPYFRTLFTNISDLNKKEFVINGVSSEIMQLIIEHFYTGKACIVKDTVKKLLPAADRFHAHDLVKLCFDILAKNLEPENGLDTYKFARKYYYRKLEKISYRYLMSNFCQIFSQSLDFLELSIDEICNILSSDDLNVKKEEIVFAALIRWIDHCPGERKCHILQLLKTVRLGFLNTRYFVENVRDHPYVKNSLMCQPLVMETIRFRCSLDLNDDKELDLDSPLARPRKPHEVLVVVGGCCNGAVSNYGHTYDSRAERWIRCYYLDKYMISYHGQVAMDTKIYIIGGYDGAHYVSSVCYYETVTKKWKEVAPMNSKRCYVCAVRQGDKIYALGGHDGRQRLKSAESYLPSSNQWSLISSMNHRRSDASATTLFDMIYVCGGFDGTNCLNSVEYYNPSTDQWTLITPMRVRRSGLGVAVLDGHIYVLGGFSGVMRLSSGEKYDPVTDSWEAIPEMFYYRSNFGLEVIDDQLFAFGGYDGMNSISGVECFDTETQEWYDVIDMPYLREAFGTCVVKGIPNVGDYTYNSPKRPCFSKLPKRTGKRK